MESNKNISSNIIPISIITVGMNHLAYLKTFLNSLYIEHPPKIRFELIYVDNCSTDGSIEFIENNYPDVLIIRNSIVKGFGENNNFGVLHSKGEYIAIINPDIILLNNSIDNLYERLVVDQSIGIIVPKLLNKDLSIQHSVRKYITLKILIWRLLAKGNDKSNNRYVQSYVCKDMDYNKEQFIDWGIGAAMMLRKDIFNDLNGFDEDYFLYMEDEDMCIRSWKSGRSVLFYPRSNMIHNHLRGSSKIGKKTYFHFKSMFTFFKKHGISVRSLIKQHNQ